MSGGRSLPGLQMTVFSLYSHKGEREGGRKGGGGESGKERERKKKRKKE